MKRLSFIAGTILVVLLAFGSVSCDRQQGTAGTQTQTGEEAQTGVAQGNVNVNTASAEELQSIPGVDQALAQNIISYREANGPFGSVDELVNVQGMDQDRLNSIRSFVSVEGQPGASPMESEPPMSEPSSPGGMDSGTGQQPSGGLDGGATEEPGSSSPPTGY